MASSKPRRPIVISGPSGTGKSTLLTRLFKAYPDSFDFCISHTTRQPRLGEKDGVEYHFVTREAFLKLIDEGGFIEHAEFSRNLYGTSVKAVKDVEEKGRRCVLDIESQGVKLIKANHPSLEPVFVFLSPPSLSALRERLKVRDTETADAIAARLAASKGELEYAHTKGAYDVVIVNDDVERAYAKLVRIAVEDRLDGSDELPPIE